MKITKTQLKEIIKKELSKVMEAKTIDDYFTDVATDLKKNPVATITLNRGPQDFSEEQFAQALRNFLPGGTNEAPQKGYEALSKKNKDLADKVISAFWGKIKGRGEMDFLLFNEEVLFNAADAAGFDIWDWMDDGRHWFTKWNDEVQLLGTPFGSNKALQILFRGYKLT
jgi:hypothetical protein